MMMVTEQLKEEKLIIMDINHPFIFIIRNINLPPDHDILFICKIEDLGNESKSFTKKRKKKLKGKKKRIVGV